jgi:hypothetical protein
MNPIMYMGETRNKKFCLENVKRVDHLEHTNAAEMMIIKIDVREIGCGYMKWIELA